MGSAGSLVASPLCHPFAECAGWVESIEMVERTVHHLTDFHPFPDARIADVTTMATDQRELSQSLSKKRNTKAPLPRVCVGWPPQQPSYIRHGG
jgi:actin-like ATPase involved in cell morphogenesis